MSPFILSLIIGLGMGAITGIANGIQTGASMADEADYYERLEEETRQKLNEDLAYLDLQYNIQKDKDIKAANQQDLFTTLNEDSVSNTVNSQLGQIRGQQEADTLSMTQARMSNDANTGAQLANAATSGTRTSSYNTNIDTNADMQNQAYESARDQQRLLQTYQTNQVINGLAQNTASIQANRTQAQDIRDSYAEGKVVADVDPNTGIPTFKVEGGGSQWQLYQQNKLNTTAQYNRYISDYSNQADNIRGDIWWRSTLAGLGGTVNGFAQWQPIGKDFAPYLLGD